MGKTILYVAMTLDGFIAGEHDDLSFLEYSKGLSESDHGKMKSFEDFFASVGSLIIGKRTYDWEMEHAGGNVNPVPKFVLTNKKEEDKKDVYFTNEPIEVVLAKAKKIAGDKNVWIEGGASVAQQFLNAHVIDELDLYVFPILLGKGIQLFEKLDNSIKLELVETNSSHGMVELKYNVV